MSTDRPTSNAGEAIGPSSVVIVKIPSKGRSGYGFVTSADTRAITLELTVSGVMWFMECATHLVFPSLTSAIPNSSPNVISTFRNSSSCLPSILRPCWSASRTNALSLLEGPSSRGIVKYCGIESCCNVKSKL